MMPTEKRIFTSVFRSGYLVGGTLVRSLLILFAVGFVLCLSAMIYLAVWGMPLAQRGFVNLSGQEAQARVSAWPDEISAAAVDSVSYQYYSSMDSHSSWYRIELTPAAADVWRDGWHSVAAEKPAGNQNYCGVDRIVTGSPPSRHPTGVPPDWWTPPAIAFRATEVHHGIRGVAVYSTYEPNTGILWIYQTSGQHKFFWKSDDKPAGDWFGNDCSDAMR